MSNPSPFTAAMDRVREKANIALATAGGIAINFTQEKYGSLDNCATLSRSFQTSFCSMRSRARKTIGVRSYDGLMCQRQMLPDLSGWQIRLFPVEGMIDDWDIISLATGKPLDAAKNVEEEILQLQQKFFGDPKHFPPNDNARLCELVPDWPETSKQLLEAWHMT